MTQADITEFLAAAARFVQASDTPPENWRLVQLWSPRTKEGFYAEEIRVSIDGKFIGEGRRALPPKKKRKQAA